MGSLTEFDEVRDHSNWSNLSRDIVESILKGLFLRDYPQFGLVCQSWQIIVADAIATNQSLPAPQAQLPMMIAYKDEVKVFSLTTKKLIHPKRPLFTKNQYCLGSIEGWFIMFDHSLWCPVGNNVSIDPQSSPFFFLNTVSNVRVNLPSEFTIPQQVDSDNCLFDKMVASSSLHCKDCFIAGLFVDIQHLAFCRLEDKSWTIIDAGASNVSFLGIEILHSKLYVLVRQGEGNLIRAYDLQNPNTTVVEELAIPSYHGITFYIYIMDSIRYVRNGNLYYLGKNAVSGELFLIQGLYDFAYDFHEERIIGQATIIQNFIHPPSTKELRVWKYQHSDSKWIEVDNLEDRSIFLSNKGFSIISTSHLTHQELERNSIYFANWKSSSGYSPFKLEIGILSLTDKTVKYFKMSKLFSSGKRIWYVFPMVYSESSITRHVISYLFCI